MSQRFTDESSSLLGEDRLFAICPPSRYPGERNRFCSTDAWLTLLEARVRAAYRCDSPTGSAKFADNPLETNPRDRSLIPRRGRRVCPDHEGVVGRPACSGIPRSETRGVNFASSSSVKNLPAVRLSFQAWFEARALAA